MKTLKYILGYWRTQIKLRPKLLITFCFISFVPLLTIAAFFYYVSTETLKEELGTYMVVTTRQVDERINAFTEEMDHLAKIIHFDQRVQDFLDVETMYDPKAIPNMLELRRFLESIDHHRTSLNSIYVINDYGNVIYSSNDLIDMDFSFMKDSWFRNIIKKSEFRLLPAHPQNYINGKSVITFAGRIFGDWGAETKGTLLLDFETNYFLEMTRSIQLGTTGYVFMLTPEGKHVIRSNKKSDELVKQLPLHILEQETGYTLIAIDGVETLVSFSTSQKTGWKIIGAVPFHEVSGKIQATKYSIVIFAILGIMFVIIASRYLSQTITRPMLKLQESMKRIEVGDLTFRAPMDRGDEIGVLSRRFNQMIEKIQELQVEVFMSDLRETKLQLLNRESELKALQMQINPHFLYNTLNTMKCVGEIYDVKEVYQMSEALAGMFKYSIDTDKYKTLEEEVNHLKAYIQIIQIRYPELIYCHYHIPPALKEILILKLLLQPIVENAIEHGLIPKGEVGNIWISAYQENDCLVIQVEDDGIGILDERMEELQQILDDKIKKEDATQKLLSEHIGLSNIQQRLDINYHKKGKMTIKSDINRGTVVQIRVPFDDGEDDDLV